MTMNTCSLAAIAYTFQKHNYDELVQSHIKPTEQIKEMELLKEADPMCEKQAVTSAQQDPPIPPLAPNFRRSNFYVGRNGYGWRTLPDGRRIKIDETQ